MILVIDGNSMINVVACASLYNSESNDITRPFYLVNGEYVIKDEAEKYYTNSMLRYMYNCIINLHGVSEVIFAVDSTSWRKKFYSQYSKLFQDRPDYDVYLEGYKGKRKIDSEQKEQLLQLIKYLSSKVMKRLQDKVSGFNFVSINGLEGDDIVAHIANTRRNEDVVVWSNDSDIHQILRKGVYIIGSNSKKTTAKKLFTYDNKVNESKASTGFDFSKLKNDFSSKSDAKAVFEGLVSRGYYVEEQVNPVKEVFTKILCGDKNSDNIPAAFSYMKDEKIVNLTKVRVSDKIYDYLRYDKNMSDDDIISKIDSIDVPFIKELSSKICSVMGVDYDKNHSLVEKGLSFNIHIIRLCEKCIPSELTSLIDDTLANNKGNKFDLNALKTLVDYE